MADRDTRRFLHENVLPVILGNGIRAHTISLRIFFKYGICSMLCAEQKNPLNFINLKCGFLQLQKLSSTSVAVEQLIDFADTYEDFKMILIPTDREGEDFLRKSRLSLESRYIIAESFFSAKESRFAILKRLIIPER